MKNTIKKTIQIITISLLGLIVLNNVYAQPIDHTFSYQGELMDNSVPADDLYDITIQGYSNLIGNPSWGDLSEHLNIAVVNGVFTIDGVDLGSGTLDGLDLYLEISVRLGGGNPTYEKLSPRQRLSSVPYATSLTNGNATNGQVYTFTGDKWQSANNTHTTYTAGTGISISGTTINNSIISLDDLSDASVFIPTNSLTIGTILPNNTGSSNLAIGSNTLLNNIDGDSNIAVGSFALTENISGNNNVAIGRTALFNNKSSNNIAIGDSAGFNSNGNGNVFLGYNAGKFKGGDNNLVIENSSSSTPLIGGDFSANEVTINGELYIKGVGNQRVDIEGASALNLLRIAGDSNNYAILSKRSPTDNSTTGSGIARLNLTELLSGPTAGAMLLDVQTNNPIYFGTNNNLRMTIENDGDVEIKQSLTAPDSGDADMKAYIYGTVSSTGVVDSAKSSSGFTATKVADGQFKITFDTAPGATYVVTANAIQGVAPRIITVLRISGSFDVFVWDVTETQVNSTFNFIVFKK